MRYSVYGLIDNHEKEKGIDFKKKCLLSYLLTAPPLVTKEMILSRIKEANARTNTKD